MLPVTMGLVCSPQMTLVMKFVVQAICKMNDPNLIQLAEFFKKMKGCVAILPASHCLLMAMQFSFPGMWLTLLNPNARSMPISLFIEFVSFCCNLSKVAGFVSKIAQLSEAG